MNFLRYHFPAILWAAVIAVLTLLPADAMPETPEWELLSFDTLAHAGVFGLLAFLLIRSFFFQYGRPEFMRFAIAVSAGLCILFGVIIELLQTIMQRGRHGETGDAISDIIGTLLGSLLFYYVFRRRSPSTSR